MGQQLQQFGKEMVDLLKSMPQCRLTYNKFITSYHHFFGHQCRVVDFGFSRLAELFDSIPHVLQVSLILVDVNVTVSCGFVSEVICL